MGYFITYHNGSEDYNSAERLIQKFIVNYIYDSKSGKVPSNRMIIQKLYLLADQLRILDNSWNYQKIAEILGISPQALSKTKGKLEENHPDLFPLNRKERVDKKTTSQGKSSTESQSIPGGI